jgi:putative endonuclease
MLNQVQHDMGFLISISPMDRRPCVYILASQKNGTLYIGVTSDLPKRLFQHRNALVPGFTSQHRVNRLVWAEMHDDMSAAIAREKQLKGWRRQWRLDLIGEINPDWRDLAVDWHLAPPLGRQG